MPPSPVSGEDLFGTWHRIVEMMGSRIPFAEDETGIINRSEELKAEWGNELRVNKEGFLRMTSAGALAEPIQGISGAGGERLATPGCHPANWLRVPEIRKTCWRQDVQALLDIVSFYNSLCIINLTHWFIDHQYGEGSRRCRYYILRFHRSSYRFHCRWLLEHYRVTERHAACV